MLLAARDGIASENFEWELTTKRNIRFKKIGSAYPLYDGDKIVGAVEFASFFYSKDHIGEIEQHSEHILYRRNHTKYILDDIITADSGMEQIKDQYQSNRAVGFERADLRRNRNREGTDRTIHS